MKFERGKHLVIYARSVISNHVCGKPVPEIEGLKEKAGVFVTVHTYPEHMLRGCIGIPEPIFPLGQSIKEAAVSTCHDPRFPRLREKELPYIVIEVTVLTPPVALQGRHEDYPSKVIVGRDGLIVEQGVFRGLLLPQVPIEYEWNSDEFLAQTCVKAGLSPNAWIDSNTIVYTFQGYAFTETEPNGEITHVELNV